jgi:NAD(P)-dependent dehydrogenase (short-subunit alcohol dehydrogenase family)
VLGLNLKAAFFVAQAAARRMIAASVPGTLIHMGSQMGHVDGCDRSSTVLRHGARGGE